MTDEIVMKLIEQVERNNELTEALLREMRHNNDRVVNYTEAAQIIGSTRQTISEYVASGKLSAVMQGGGLKKGIRLSELEKITRMYRDR